MEPRPGDQVRMPHCSVCLSNWTDESDTTSSVCRLPCGHLFHNDCAQKWLRKKNSCPMCRAAVEEEEGAYSGGGQSMRQLRVPPPGGWSLSQGLSRSRPRLRDNPPNLPGPWSLASESRRPFPPSHGARPSWAGAVSRALPQRTLGLARSRILSTVARHRASDHAGPSPHYPRVRQNPFLEQGMNPYLHDPLPMNHTSMAGTRLADRSPGTHQDPLHRYRPIERPARR